MTTTHNYASCQVPVCLACDSYADGYTAGKTKAFFEIEQAPDRTHSQTCGCRPCTVVRGVVKRVDSGDRRADRHDRERPHLQDCAGPGCGASCTCWCHATEAESI